MTGPLQPWQDRGVPDAEIEAMFAKYDTDGDMRLNAEEQRKLKEDLIKQADQITKDIAVTFLISTHVISI